MTQVAKKWIADRAIDHTKLDSSDSYQMSGLLIKNGPNITMSIDSSGNISANSLVTLQDETNLGNITIAQGSPDSTWQIEAGILIPGDFQLRQAGAGTGLVYLNGTAGRAIIDGDTTVNGGLEVGANTLINGDATVTGGIEVGGLASFPGTIADGTFVGGIYVGTDATVVGALDVGARIVASNPGQTAYGALAKTIIETFDVGSGSPLYQRQFSLKARQDGLSHGVTDIIDTDAYGTLRPIAQPHGGMEVMGLTDDNGINALKITGVSASSPTQPCIDLQGSKKSGTTESFLADGEAILQVSNMGSAKVIIKGNGDTTVGNSLVLGSSDYRISSQSGYMTIHSDSSVVVSMPGVQVSETVRFSVSADGTASFDSGNGYGIKLSSTGTDAIVESPNRKLTLQGSGAIVDTMGQGVVPLSIKNSSGGSGDTTSCLHLEAKRTSTPTYLNMGFATYPTHESYITSEGKLTIDTGVALAGDIELAPKGNVALSPSGYVNITPGTGI